MHFNGQLVTLSTLIALIGGLGDGRTGIILMAMQGNPFKKTKMMTGMKSLEVDKGMTVMIREKDESYAEASYDELS